jgi:hypothetical protein
MRRLAALPIILCLALPAPAEANPFCSWLGLCFYYSPGFELTVVDAETSKPLPGVYAWAEWVQYGAHGLGGPLVVQDGFTDASGRLSFPRWGPMRGSRIGLPLGRDPAVILFKSGYTTMLAQNSVPPGSSHHAAIRDFWRRGETLRLQSFRGTAADWAEQVQRLAYPAIHGYVQDSHRDHFGTLYLRRAGIAIDELSKLPRDTAKVEALLRGLDRSVRFYRGEE